MTNGEDVLREFPDAVAIDARELVARTGSTIPPPAVSVADVLRREVEVWKTRYRVLADMVSRAPARTVVLRSDPASGVRLRVDRVHDYARAEAERGDVVLCDEDALRLMCAAVGLEVRPMEPRR